MLRNQLMNDLTDHPNIHVTVDVGGFLIDVDAVRTDRGNIVLILDPDELPAVLKQLAVGGTRPDELHAAHSRD